ncbi:MAG: LacI family DNA-binding transcriptional regulator [Motilibacteraceae bacterium]
MVGTSVTLYDVAQRAGVSLATASRALNGSPGRTVGPALRERVERAASELGYTPNAFAQAMVRRRTDLAGLLVHDIADPYFSSVAAGAMREAERHDLLVSIASTGRDPQAELDHVASLRRHRARLVVLVGSRSNPDATADRLAAELAAFRAEGGRVVAVSQPRLGVDTVEIDNRGGARALGRAMHDLGYRRCAVLAGPTSLVTAVDRLAGFREAMARRGAALDPALVVHGDFTRDGGHSAMRDLLAHCAASGLELGTDVDAVFAVNDVMAVGAMTALREGGIALPGPVGVAGFDDIATLRDVHPPLTTVQVPLEEVGARAVRLAMDEPGADVGEPRVETVSTTVVLRASTPKR